MSWRRPGFTEAWETALVLLVLGAGAFLLASLQQPGTGDERAWRAERSCETSEGGGTGCSPLLEGRAVGRHLPPEP